MAERKPGIGKGVLSPGRVQGRYETQRFHASNALRGCLFHFWQVTWALPPGETFVQDTVPYPSVHIVLEEGRSEVVGPMTGRFSRCLEGEGVVLGAHVRPGMFSALSATPMSALVDARLPLSQALAIGPEEAQALEGSVLSLPSSERTDAFDSHLARLVRPGELTRCKEVADLVTAVEGDSCIRSAQHLAERAGLSLRTLQRRFRERVGLTPKAVILRFRLIEAAERLARGEVSCAQLASELGYADQSHFVRAFKALTGETPEKYSQESQTL